MDEISWDNLKASPTNIIEFMVFLENRRAIFSTSDWKSFVATDKRLNEWRNLLFNDPYTRWGYCKPRGYPGDASLMDFAYKHLSVSGVVDDASANGKLIYEYTSNAPQSKSAVSRTQFISSLIENVGGSNITVASIASGHGREFEYLPEATLRNIKSVLAVDSDDRSLSTLQETSLNSVNVTPINKNVFKTKLSMYGNNDLVYSLGLFDYLNDDLAVKVLENMCSSVKPGGTVIVANLHHQAANLGYCEAIMDWWMITRSEDDLLGLSERVQNIDPSWKVEIERIDCFCYLIAHTS